MKILFLTDTHIGARNSSSIFRDLFRRYYANVLFPYIKDNDIKHVIHLGDFFDDRNKLTLHDLDYIKNEYISEFEQTDAEMYIIAGNHDVAFRNTNSVNSLSIFRGHDKFHIVDQEVFTLDLDGYKLVLCPWLNSTNIDQLMEDVKIHANDNSILCGHFEIQNTKMYKNSPVCEHGLDPNLFKNYGRVLSGHFHHPSVYGNIEYIGALFHYNWQDYNDWRGFQVLDTDTGLVERIENTDCLFSECDLSDLAGLEDYSIFSNKIVRLIINTDYKQVDLKEQIAKIESASPFSLDVVDNTILNSSLNLTESSEDEPTEVKTKEVVEYFETAFNDHEQKDQLIELAKQLYDEAKSKMKEIE